MVFINIATSSQFESWWYLLTMITQDEQGPEHIMLKCAQASLVEMILSRWAPALSWGRPLPVAGCLSTFCTGTLGITWWRMIFNGFCLNGKGVPRGSFRQTHPLPKWKMNIFVCTFPIGWMQNRTVFYVMYFRDREWGPAQVGLSIISLESDSICWSVGHIYNEDNIEKSWILNSDSDHISHLRRAL